MQLYIKLPNLFLHINHNNKTLLLFSLFSLINMCHVCQLRRLIQLSWWEAVWHSKLSGSLDSLIIKLYPPKPVCCLDEDSLYQYWKAKAFRSKVFEDKYILMIIYCSFYNFVMFDTLRPWIIKLVCCLMYCQILDFT